MMRFLAIVPLCSIFELLFKHDSPNIPWQDVVSLFLLVVQYFALGFIVAKELKP